MMYRTQLSLEPEMQREARKRAAGMGISFAEYVRRLIAGDVAGPRRSADASAVFNLGDSGGTDVARSKDALIGEAVSARRRRRRR
jgi:hypothetical protein